MSREIKIIRYNTKSYMKLDGKNIIVDFIDKEINSIVQGKVIYDSNQGITEYTTKMKILENVKGPKVYGMKYRRRTHGTKKKWGHRAKYTVLEEVR